MYFSAAGDVGQIRTATPPAVNCAFDFPSFYATTLPCQYMFQVYGDVTHSPFSIWQWFGSDTRLPMTCQFRQFTFGVFKGHNIYILVFLFHSDMGQTRGCHWSATWYFRLNEHYISQAISVGVAFITVCISPVLGSDLGQTCGCHWPVNNSRLSGLHDGGLGQTCGCRSSVNIS